MKYQCYLCKKLRKRSEVELKEVDKIGSLRFVCKEKRCRCSDCLYFDGIKCSIADNDSEDCLCFTTIEKYQKEEKRAKNEAQSD